MSDAFFGRLVSSEQTVIKSNEMSLALKKVSSDDVKGLAMEERSSSFKLPSGVDSIGSGDINAQVRMEIKYSFNYKKKMTKWPACKSHFKTVKHVHHNAY